MNYTRCALARKLLMNMENKKYAVCAVYLLTLYSNLV